MDHSRLVVDIRQGVRHSLRLRAGTALSADQLARDPLGRVVAVLRLVEGRHRRTRVEVRVGMAAAPLDTPASSLHHLLLLAPHSEAT